MLACDSGGGYNKMSTAGFGANPHPGSTGELRLSNQPNQTYLALLIIDS